MSWYVRKTIKPPNLEQTIYYSFEKKEKQNQESKKQIKQPSRDDKTTTEKQPKKRKPAAPLPTNPKSVKKKKT